MLIFLGVIFLLSLKRVTLYYTISDSLAFIQKFDKFNNFTEISFSKTVVIFQISDCFLKWVITCIEVITWNICNFSASFSGVFAKKALRIWYNFIKFIFSFFENLFKNSQTVVFHNI